MVEVSDDIFRTLHMDHWNNDCLECFLMFFNAHYVTQLLDNGQVQIGRIINKN